MRYLALFTLLSLLQAATPVPPPVVNNPGKESNKGQNQTRSDETKPVEGSTGKTSIQPEVSTNDSSNQTLKKGEKVISVRVPPIDVNKDRADYLYIAASLLLTLATLIIAIYAAVQARAAKRSADNDEKTIRLTERADVLIEAIGISPFDGTITLLSYVQFTLKNFGRTRANNVAVEISLRVPEMPEQNPHALPNLVLASNDSQRVVFDPFDQWLNLPTFRLISEGDAILRFHAEIRYEDVFGDPHLTEASGYYNASTRGFRLEKTKAD